LIATFRTAGLTGIIAGFCVAFSFICFIFSLTHTTVANTLFLISSAPFMTALLGRIILLERVQRTTLMAMFTALIGITIMVWEGAATGGLFGNLTALGAALGFAGYTVALRRGRAVEMLPAACLAGLLATFFTGFMAIPVGFGLAISAHDLLLAVIYGGMMSSGIIIYTKGSRYVPAAELTLLSLAEVVLGPIWVWLGIGEVPSGMTLLGGAIVLTAIVGQALIGMWRRPQPIVMI